MICRSLFVYCLHRFWCLMMVFGVDGFRAFFFRDLCLLCVCVLSFSELLFIDIPLIFLDLISSADLFVFFGSLFLFGEGEGEGGAVFD